MTRAERERIAAYRRVEAHLRTGRSLTRKEAPLLGITPARLETAIRDLRGRGARINKFKGDYGAWVYVAHERGLFENLEKSEPTKTDE